jgi:ubiquinone/menaquinone biosynthesis C-methylase UbiE
MEIDGKTFKGESLNLEKIKEFIQFERDNLLKHNRTSGKKIDDELSRVVKSLKIDLDLIHRTLRQIHEYSDIGQVPKLIRFKGVKKRIAKLVSKIILYALQFITNKQKFFNSKVLEVFQEMMNVNQKLVFLLSYLKTQIPPKQLGMPEIDDSLYASFEDVFRGPREVIKKRLEIYLPILKEAGIDKNESPLIDLGSGRGEWLELMREHCLRAKGIDNNSVMVEMCRAKGFEVVKGDAIEYLKVLPDESAGAITGFHFIEHVPFNYLLILLKESLRVLIPGGVVIFETPNPQHLLTGASNFYIDPTHLKPVHPLTLKFFMEVEGFKQICIKGLHESENVKIEMQSEEANNPLALYQYQDYVAIGYK